MPAISTNYRAFSAASTTGERLRLVTEARQTFSPQAAREMWFKQGLPIVPSMINPAQNDLFHYGMVNHGEQAA